MAFKGGSKFESALNKIVERAQSGGVLKVGFLEGATYPDGQKVAQVAAWNEYGTVTKTGKQHIPPRPFFRNAIAENKGEWGKTIAKIMVATDYDVEQSLGLLGSKIRGQIMASIRNTNEPPNSELTVHGLIIGKNDDGTDRYLYKGKGFNNPLIDTSHMLNSVDYEISDAEP
ncbi:MAG: hypothetical protein HGA87_00320 [Desulfobulbaceae bacterium]|nr:hypothetical protein [Desulfobulbaceae bacterium]